MLHGQPNIKMSKGVQIQIFNTNVKSVLLYGCETWENYPTG